MLMSVCRQPHRLGNGKDGKNQSELKSHEATHERRSTSTGAWRCYLDDTGTQVYAPGASHLAVLNMKLGRGVLNCLRSLSNIFPAICGVFRGYRLSEAAKQILC